MICAKSGQADKSGQIKRGLRTDKDNTLRVVRLSGPDCPAVAGGQNG